MGSAAASVGSTKRSDVVSVGLSPHYDTSIPTSHTKLSNCVCDATSTVEQLRVYIAAQKAKIEEWQATLAATQVSFSCSHPLEDAAFGG
jgi:hypothetical protein